MNRIKEKYGRLGVQVVGIQTTRRPLIRKENIVHVCERLKPDFPVFDNAWICETPVAYLPWAAVFDHRGKRIFAHNLPGMEEAIAGAVAAAPHYLVGGPYEKLAGLAAEIMEKPTLLGACLPDIRRLASSKDGDPGKKAEATALAAHAERFALARLERAREELPDLVAAHRVAKEAAAIFAGDQLGQEAKALLEELESDPLFPHAVKAAAELDSAGAAFRKLPPAGHYTYNLDYFEVEDEKTASRRARIFIEFRLALMTIIARYPETHAASQAKRLLEEHTMPIITASEAGKKFEQACALMGNPETDYEFYDGFLSFHEIAEAYDDSDELRGSSLTVIASMKKKQAARIEKSRRAYGSLNSRAGTLMDQIEASGSVLGRKKAGQIIGDLRKTAREAGLKSSLAGRIEAFLTELEESLNGPAVLGVALEDPDSGVGVELDRVFPGGAAWMFGLKTLDVIVAINGKTIEDQAAFRAVLAKCRPGQTATVKVIRSGSGKEEEVEIVLGRRIQRKGY